MSTVPEMLITPDELSARLGCSTETIYRKRDELPHYRFGARILFDWEEVLDYLKEGEHGD